MKKIKTAHLIAILEGIIVIVVELGFANLMSFYFGNSIDVWTTNLTVTMLALTAGYLLSVKLYQALSVKKVFIILNSTLLLLFVLLSFNQLIFEFILSLEFHTGLILGSLIFIFSIVTPISITLPFIVVNASNNKEEKARHTGDLFFLSTISSILTCLFFCFWMIENWGVINSMKVILLLCLTVLLAIGILKKHISSKLAIISIVLVAFAIFSSNNNSRKDLYHSDGLLGTVNVQDFQFNNTEGRKLLLNNTMQTVIDKKSKSSFGNYFHLLRQIIRNTNAKESKNALLLGLGGGTTAMELESFGYSVTAIELDKRIADVSKKYFYPQLKADIKIMDGRYFLNQTDEQYDYVILDVFISENTPFQLLTIESFSKIYNCLTENGCLFINFNGFWTGSESKSTKAILKTLIAAGFQTSMYPTPEKEDQRNIIFVGKKNQMFNSEVFFKNHVSSPIKYIDEDYQHSPLLKDSNPILPILNRKSVIAWRKYGIEFIRDEYFKE